MRVFLSLVFLVALISQAQGRTITVEQDGSGDFMYLQDAAEAAVSGDTILIGPGEYGADGATQPSSCQGDQYRIHMNIPVERLTIIGSGKDSTIIGPTTPYDPYEPYRSGINFDGYCGAKFGIVKDIGFRNMSKAVASFPGGGDFPMEGTGIIVENCGFDGVITGVIFNGDRTIVKDCHFRSGVGQPSFVVNVSGGNARVVEIRDCQTEIVNRSTSHLSVGRVDSLFVEGCEFGVTTSGNGTGINAAAGYLEISDCRFLGLRAGIGTRAATVVVEWCDFIDVGFGFFFNGWPPSESVGISFCNFEDVSISSIAYDDRTTVMAISNCNLEKGEQYAVELSPYAGKEIEETQPPLGPYSVDKDDNHPSGPRGKRTELIHFDARNNYWGTDIPDSIQAWIEDRRDDPEIPIIVDWDPFEPSIVSTGNTTLDALRALYR